MANLKLEAKEGGALLARYRIGTMLALTALLWAGDKWGWDGSFMVAVFGALLYTVLLALLADIAETITYAIRAGNRRARESNLRWAVDHLKKRVNGGA